MFLHLHPFVWNILVNHSDCAWPKSKTWWVLVWECYKDSMKFLQIQVDTNITSKLDCCTPCCSTFFGHLALEYCLPSWQICLVAFNPRRWRSKNAKSKDFFLLLKITFCLLQVMFTKKDLREQFPKKHDESTLPLLINISKLDEIGNQSTVALCRCCYSTFG